MECSLEQRGRRLGIRSIAIGLLAGLASGSAAHEERFDALGLTLRLPELEEFEHASASRDESSGTWSGKLRGASVAIEFTGLDAEKYGFDEPEDVAETMREHRERNPRPGSIYRFESERLVAGEYGSVPYASLGEARWIEERATRTVARTLSLCGLVDGAGYALELTCTPPLDEEGARDLREALAKCILYDGPRRDPEWTEEEVRTRWERDAPESEREELEDVIRTEHYIVFSSSSGGKLFARKMEECYERIQAIFPFDEVPGRRLMPVFLFRTPDEYYDFYVRVRKVPRERAMRSKGHASRDYYATWYEAPNDPVHVHEATHQIFRNRLRLSGGGSWFQEGVAEYVETRENDRNAIAREVKKGRHTPLRELMQLQSLLHSSEDDERGGSKASDHYKLAALLIEFLRESRFGKERFLDFVHAVGAVPRNDLPEIEAALQSVYGVGIDELDAEFVAYCKKR